MSADGREIGSLLILMAASKGLDISKKMECLEARGDRYTICEQSLPGSVEKRLASQSVIPMIALRSSDCFAYETPQHQVHPGLWTKEHPPKVHACSRNSKLSSPSSEPGQHADCRHRQDFSLDDNVFDNRGVSPDVGNSHKWQLHGFQ